MKPLSLACWIVGMSVVKMASAVRLCRIREEDQEEEEVLVQMTLEKATWRL